MIEPLDEATALLARTEMELEAKGYSEGLAQAAVARARGIADYKTAKVSPGIRSQAFLDVLRDELTHCEKWIGQEVSQVETGAEPVAIDS